MEQTETENQQYLATLFDLFRVTEGGNFYLNHIVSLIYGPDNVEETVEKLVSTLSENYPDVSEEVVTEHGETVTYSLTPIGLMKFLFLCPVSHCEGKTYNGTDIADLVRGVRHALCIHTLCYSLVCADREDEKASTLPFGQVEDASSLVFGLGI
jgi:hypothetical protein